MAADRERMREMTKQNDMSITFTINLEALIDGHQDYMWLIIEPPDQFVYVYRSGFYIGEFIVGGIDEYFY